MDLDSLLELIFREKQAGRFILTRGYGFTLRLATNAFGQNFNVTMTQLAASFCSLINGGNYYEPHVVKQIQDENGNVTENKDPVLAKTYHF